MAVFQETESLDFGLAEIQIKEDFRLHHWLEVAQVTVSTKGWNQEGNIMCLYINSNVVTGKITFKLNLTIGRKNWLRIQTPKNSVM